MIEIKSLQEYDELSRYLLENYKHVPVWLFEGEMGAGKTTLIRHILKAAGVQDEVSSPTFAIVNEYAGARGEVIYHMDCYRLSSADEALHSGLDEILTSGKWCLVEWPVVIENFLWGKTLFITFEKMGNIRRIQYELKTYE